MTRAEIERLVRSAIFPDELTVKLDAMTENIIEEGEFAMVDWAWHPDDAANLIDWLLNKLEAKASDA